MWSGKKTWATFFETVFSSPLLPPVIRPTAKLHGSKTFSSDGNWNAWESFLKLFFSSLHAQASKVRDILIKDKHLIGFCFSPPPPKRRNFRNLWKTHLNGRDFRSENYGDLKTFLMTKLLFYCRHKNRINTAEEIANSLHKHAANGAWEGVQH